MRGCELVDVFCGDAILVLLEIEATSVDLEPCIWTQNGRLTEQLTGVV